MDSNNPLQVEEKKQERHEFLGNLTLAEYEAQERKAWWSYKPAKKKKANV